MDSIVKEALEKVMTVYNFDENEKKFIEYSHTHITADINHSKVLVELLLTKQIKASTENFIQSNKELADAQNSHSEKMQKLTWALIFVGFLQATAMIVSLYITYIK